MTDRELLDEAYKCSHAAAEVTENLSRGKRDEVNSLGHLKVLAQQLTCAALELHNRSKGNKPKPLAP